MSFETDPAVLSHASRERESGDLQADDSDRYEREDGEIDRGETGTRLLLTLLFFIISRVVESVLVVLVLFELGFALVTQREPSDAVRRVGNQMLSYLVRIGRYITYNDDEPPFPLREFPDELDLTVPLRENS